MKQHFNSFIVGHHNPQVGIRHDWVVMGRVDFGWMSGWVDALDWYNFWWFFFVRVTASFYIDSSTF